jgi:ABC-type transporter Mla MlaB component
MHLSLHQHLSHSTIAVDGSLTAASIEGVIDMFAMVPIGQPLVVDLSRVNTIDSVATSALHEELRARAVEATVTVVVDDVDVAMQLVLHDVDRCAQMVRTRVDAIALATGVLAGQR